MNSAESTESCLLTGSKLSIAEKNRLAKIKFLKEQLLSSEAKEKVRRNSMETIATQREYIPTAKDLSVPGTPVSSRYFANINKNRRIVIDSSESEEEYEIENFKQRHIEMKNKEVYEYFASSETKKTYQRTFSEVVQVSGEIKVKNPDIEQYFAESGKKNSYSRPFSQVVFEPSPPLPTTNLPGDLSVPGTPVSSRSINKINPNYNDASDSEDHAEPTDVAKNKEMLFLNVSDTVKEINEKLPVIGVALNESASEVTTTDTIDPVKQFINDMDTLRKRDVDDYFEDSVQRSTYKRTFSEAVSVLGEVKHKNPKVEEYFTKSEMKNTFRRPFSEVYQEWMPTNKGGDISIPGTPVDSKNFLSKLKLKKFSNKFKVKDSAKKDKQTQVENIKSESYKENVHDLSLSTKTPPEWIFDEAPDQSLKEQPPQLNVAESSIDVVVTSVKINEAYDYSNYALGDILLPGTPVSTAHIANCKSACALGTDDNPAPESSPNTIKLVNVLEEPQSKIFKDNSTSVVNISAVEKIQCIPISMESLEWAQKQHNETITCNNTTQIDAPELIEVQVVEKKDTTLEENATTSKKCEETTETKPKSYKVFDETWNDTINKKANKTCIEEFLQESIEKNTYSREFSEVCQTLGDSETKIIKIPEVNNYFKSSEAKNSYSRTFSEAVQETNQKKFTVSNLLKPGTPIASVNTDSPTSKQKATKSITKQIDSRKSSIDSSYEDDIIDATKAVLSPHARRKPLRRVGASGASTTDTTKEDIIQDNEGDGHEYTIDD